MSKYDETECFPRVLVMGCGGIGGVIAAHLAELGVDVVAYSRNQQVVDSVAASGFRLVGESGRRAIPGRVVGEIPEGPFELVLLATQPTDVEEAARQALPALAKDGHMVCFQNGLCEDRVAAILGDPNRVLGGIIAWGATMVEPGVYDKTSAGGFVLGSMGDASPAALGQLETLLSCIGPVQCTDNLAGARWSKLAINCMISSLGTLNGTRLGEVVKSRVARRLGLEVITEVVQVAERLGIRLEKIAGTIDLGWLRLSDAERKQSGSVSLAAKHAMLLAVGMRFRRLYSSMLRAVESGKTPAIDFLNGEIVKRGQQLEIATPINEAVCARVWAMSRREIKPGPALLQELFETTR